MDQSRVWQTELKHETSRDLLTVNTFTRRLCYHRPLMKTDYGNFEIPIALSYNANYNLSDYGGKTIGFSNGWKLNIEQYVFPYDESYNMEGFEVGDYVYIDADWHIHRFVKYHNNVVNTYKIDYYYGFNNINFRLYVNERGTKEIIDSKNNRLIFDSLGNLIRLVSGVNQNIRKTIQYYQNHIDKVYDERDRENGFTFEYTNNQLQKIINKKDNNQIIFEYDEENNLLNIQQNLNNKKRFLAEYSYNEDNKVYNFFDYITYRAYEIYYEKIDGTLNVGIVKELSYKNSDIKKSKNNAMYLSNDLYLGNSVLLTDKQHIFDKTIKETDESRIIKHTIYQKIFTYLVVKELRGIEYRYYFDVNGKVISILENKENTSHYSLFKSNGWLISENSNNDISINNNSITNLDSNTFHVKKSDNDGNNRFNQFMINFKNDRWYIRNENVEDFYVSFWLKCDKNLTENSKGILRFCYGYTTLEQEFKLQKALGHNWQYVTVPIILNVDVQNVEELIILFENITTDSNLSIADVKIGIGVNTRVYINDVNLADVDELTVVDKYDRTEHISINNDFYLTQYDIEETYKNLFLKNKTYYNNDETFDLVYCNGHKVKRVKNVCTSYDLFMENKFEIDSDGNANFKVQMSYKFEESTYNIIETKHKYIKLSGKDIFIDQIETSYDNVNNRCSNHGSSAYNYIKKLTFDGTLYSEEDNHGKKIEYVYDDYGNIEEVIEKSCIEDESRVFYLYDEDEEYLRRFPDKVTFYDECKEYIYDIKNGNLLSYVENNMKVLYEYDDFDEYVTTIKFYDQNYNLISTNYCVCEYDKILKQANTANQYYDYYYNSDGELSKVFTNKYKCFDVEKVKNIISTSYIENKYANSENIIENKQREYEYNLSELLKEIKCADNITKLYYQGELNPYNENGNTDEKSRFIDYKYKHNESLSIQKPIMINDPYRQCRIVFYYDHNNNVIGYDERVIDDITPLSKRINKCQKDDNTISYELYDYNNKTAPFNYKITYDCDDLEYKTPNKRIIKTEYEFTTKDIIQNHIQNIDSNYEYDKFGRIIQKFINQSIRNHYVYSYQYNEHEKKYIKKFGTNNITPKLTEILNYDKINKNNKITITEFGHLYCSHQTDAHEIDKEKIYNFDDFNRIIYESNEFNEIYNYSYDQCGNINKVIVNDEITKEFTYDLDKLIGYKKADNNVFIEYDLNGNISTIGSKTFKFNQSNLIEECYNGNTNSTTKYKYTYDGVLYKKEKNYINNPENDYVINYYLDNGRILAEERKTSNDTKFMMYTYDLEGISSIIYKNEVYHLQKDCLGNVIRIIHDEYMICEYVYDAWGNTRTIYYGDYNEDYRYVIDNNPFRYRGYYYDIETQLYWVSSRYYSPELCRWISPDSIEYLDPQSINGLNLYAYCANDPINKYDPTGHFPWLILAAAILLFTPVGGTVAQVATSALSYAGMAVASIFDEDIRNDMNAIGWNPFNTDESATLSSSKVSFYKGVPVFRTAAGGRSGSFGAIFLTKGSGVDTLRHERGHNWQLMMMGIANYGLMIGLPSWLEWSNRSYYDRSWEITADVFGGVTGRTHSQADINRGYWYLGVSSLFGPLGYFFLFGEY